MSHQRSIKEGFPVQLTSLPSRCYPILQSHTQKTEGGEGEQEGNPPLDFLPVTAGRGTPAADTGWAEDRAAPLNEQASLSRV